MIKIALADDHDHLKKSVKLLLQEEVDLEINIEANDGEELIANLPLDIPDIILMDIRMPRMNGIQATAIVLKLYPSVKIIAFTQFDEEENIVRMNALGIKSFVLKYQPKELIKAIRIVSDGGVYMPDEVAHILSTYLNKSIKQALTNQCPVYLQEYEKQLIQAISEGKSSNEISGLIFKSPRTVEKYRQALYQKFGVKTKEEMLVLAVRWGIVS